jgi:hypothetical protein
VEEPPADDWDSVLPPQPAPTFEKRAAIDLVEKKPRALEHREVKARSKRSKPADFAERIATVRPPRRRRRRRWLAFFVLLMSLALLGGGGYHYRNRIPRQQLRWFVASTIARGHAFLSRLRIR